MVAAQGWWCEIENGCEDNGFEDDLQDWAYVTENGQYFDTGSSSNNGPLGFGGSPSSFGCNFSSLQNSVNTILDASAQVVNGNTDYGPLPQPQLPYPQAGGGYNYVGPQVEFFWCPGWVQP